MTSDVTFASALNQQQKTAAASDGLAEDFSEFLTLLTVQLQNQDPLSPMDTTEFTNQLVAFTGVEQQINTNQKLDSLVSLELGNSFSSAQSYVGKNISYVSSEFDYSGSPSTIKYSLGSDAILSQVNVLNESGEIIYTTEGSRTAGAHEFVWNGQTNSGQPALPGTYEVVVDALDAEENTIQTTTVVTGKVRGAETQSGQIFLLVGDRAVPVSNVLNTSTSDQTAGQNDALTMALSYVGLNAFYKNSQIDHDGSTPTNIVYNLEREADQAKLIVSDENGKTVYVGDVDTDVGQNLTSWDGTRTDGSDAPQGQYYFTISALDEDFQSISATSLEEGLVDGVETDNGITYLTFGNKRIALDDIVSVGVPATSTGS